jgi:ACR3 family arsenite transporter
MKIAVYLKLGQQTKTKKLQKMSEILQYKIVRLTQCMVIGILIGKYLGFILEFLKQFEYHSVSIPIAILIWFIQ